MKVHSVWSAALGLAWLAGCAPTGSGPAVNATGGTVAQGGATGSGPGSGGSVALGGNAAGGTVVSLGGTSSAGEAAVGGGGPVRNPNSCEEAEKFRTYLGCEYFPTVLANVVNPVFDFAVVVANAGDQAADITVTGPNSFSATATVGAHELVTVYLPWVDSLKGPSLPKGCASAAAMTASVLARGGAYRLKSSRPVAAYQFNPLEFRAAGGPAGKVWSCVASPSPDCECNSFSNDASLLLPKNALTSNYVAFTWRDQGSASSSKPVTIAVTGLVDATEVAVRAGPRAKIQAGPAGSGLDAAMPNDVIRFTLNQGDVVELVAVPGSDLSGTQIQASEQKPIQVIAGSPSATAPTDTVRSADHIEEVVFPAETVGKDYVVPVPTGPHAKPVRHVVRIYGVAKSSTLAYFPAKPAGAPDSIAASEVSEFEATTDFQVQGSEPFAVGSFLVGGQLLDPDSPPQNSAGDPSQSFLTTVAQYRDKYVFLAPIDYEGNFVDIVVPAGVTLALDGLPVDLAQASTLAGRAQDGLTPRDFRVVRVALDAGPRFVGAHEITASAPVGLQVVGYGRFTSYQYPGGLNLNLISEPPIVIPPR